MKYLEPLQPCSFIISFYFCIPDIFRIATPRIYEYIVIGLMLLECKHIIWGHKLGQSHQGWLLYGYKYHGEDGDVHNNTFTNLSLIANYISVV